ncbi:hypothetical protein JB92DRAFT_2901144 [Gautieria morchelliformis]|nr:hypothetical protein JB92DRAFT_2901144 [Gautieria morchelliformis]
MAACSGEELEVTWAREKNTLQQECHVKLRQELLNLAQARMLKLTEGRHASHPPEDELLTDLQQRLETITLSGKRLSHIFMNSLGATLTHRLAATSTHFKNNQSKDLAPEESRATQKDDAYDYEVSGRSLPAPSPPRRLVDGTLGHDAQPELAALVRARADLYRRLSEQRALLAKRSVYLCECRAAAEKEKETMQKVLTTARLSLSTAEIEQALAANDRTIALEELKHAAFPGNHNQTEHIACASLGIKDLGASTRAMAHQLRHGIAPCIPLPLSTCPSTCPALTPSGSLDSTESTSHSGDSPSTPVVMIGDKRMSPKHLVEFKENHELRESIVTGHSGAKDELANTPGTLENPIGPYIRPPMPLEDMRRCVRCLFGKDKSLKTGNRARAFLGVPWSQIVSFDPDVLLARGVLGIKEGSTGMASRLRMMTIIESALSNQNNDAIPAEVWEKPTHFCESCQKRYPITVGTNQAVLPFEESVQRMTGVMRYQVSANAKAQGPGGATNPHGKRNRKRLRLARPATHRLR